MMDVHCKKLRFGDPPGVLSPSIVMQPARAVNLMAYVARIGRP